MIEGVTCNPGTDDDRIELIDMLAQVRGDRGRLLQKIFHVFSPGSAQVEWQGSRPRPLPCHPPRLCVQSHYTGNPIPDAKPWMVMPKIFIS